MGAAVGEMMGETDSGALIFVGSLTASFIDNFNASLYRGPRR